MRIIESVAHFLALSHRPHDNTLTDWPLTYFARSGLTQLPRQRHFQGACRQLHLSECTPHTRTYYKRDITLTTKTDVQFKLELPCVIGYETVC